MRHEALEQKRTGTRRSVGEAAARRWILDWLADHLETPLPHDGAEIRLADLGLDSMRAVRLVQNLNEWFGIRLQPTATWNFTTAAAMARQVASDQDDGADASALLGRDQATEALILAELMRLNR
jgi:acyl carrier protein